MSDLIRVRFLLNWDGRIGPEAGFEFSYTVELPASAVPLEGDRIRRNGETYEVLRRTWHHDDDVRNQPDVTVRADSWDVIQHRQREVQERRELRRAEKAAR